MREFSDLKIVHACRALVALAALLAASPLKAEERKAAAGSDAAIEKLDLSAPARALFGAKKKPAHLDAEAVGFYAKGCLAGGQVLPIDGATWQVMRLSRNRNWGHPNLIAMIESLAAQTPKISNWPGLLIGDLAQPRGGPMLSSHASHQIGLDVDIWLTPMPDRRLTREERETVAAPNVVNSNWTDVEPSLWGPAHGAVIKAAAQHPEVDRIFVNAAIKKALCRDAGWFDRGWLHKVRPYYLHQDHFHVRLRCPKDSPTCVAQPSVPEGEGCGADLNWWFGDKIRFPKPPGAQRPPMPLSALPAACRKVLAAP